MSYEEFKKERITALQGGIEVSNMILEEIKKGVSLQGIEAFVKGIKESSENMIEEYKRG